MLKLQPSDEASFSCYRVTFQHLEQQMFENSIDRPHTKRRTNAQSIADFAFLTCTPLFVPVLRSAIYT